MHVIVTGGSSGIGLAVARLYAARGVRLSLVARDVSRLERARAALVADFALDPEMVRIASVNVASASDISTGIAACEEALGPCDILIASAGIVEPAAFDQLSPEMFSAQIDINLTGTANAVRSVYTGMKARQRGRIMIISSGAALIGIHGYTAYCASKAGLTGFAEALAAEARACGIHVGICFPPDTLTPQYEREMQLRPPEARSLMGTVKPWSAEAVARRIVQAVDRRRSKVYFSASLMALAYFGAFVKPWLAWRHRA